MDLSLTGERGSPSRLETQNSSSKHPTYQTPLSLPARRSKFENYTAVTLGLEGEEGEKVSTRLWNAVDAHLKKEVGPGVDCLLTRVQARCGLVVCSCGTGKGEGITGFRRRVV